MSVSYRSLAEYDETLILDAGHVGARASRACLRVEMGDEVEAGADFDEFIRGDPESASACVLRGGWHLTSNRFAQSVPDLEKALELDPELKPVDRGRRRAHRDRPLLLVVTA